MYNEGILGDIYFFLYRFDLVWMFGILLVLLAVLIVIVIVQMIRLRLLWVRYDLFMRGKNAETLEGNIVRIYHQLQTMQTENKENKELVKVMKKCVTNTYSKMGLVKYNAFPGMGGENSFALTLLNMENNGVILDAIHSRENCYLYVREIQDGIPSDMLTDEEQESLRKALYSVADAKGEDGRNLLKN